MPYSDKIKRRIHTAWKNMLQRCENPSCDGYARYGGRGISVCAEWHKFEPFYRWSLSHGYSENLTLDRRDNDKGYSPDNCRWVTQKENSRNRGNNYLITFNGETLCVSEWAERVGISHQAMCERLISGGWSLEEALTIRKRTRKAQQISARKNIIQISKDGKIISAWNSISNASESLGIPSSNISRALKNKNHTAGGFCWRYGNGVL